jgi:1,4-alpha-glucan branching enzyme
MHLRIPSHSTTVQPRRTDTEAEEAIKAHAPNKNKKERKMQTTTSQNKKFAGSPTQFAFEAPTSQRVSLAGNFNNWDTNAAPMHKGADGIWRLSLPLGPGQYEYRFYADGVWRDDPGAQQRAANALGTENCVRIVTA